MRNATVTDRLLETIAWSQSFFLYFFMAAGLVLGFAVTMAATGGAERVLLFPVQYLTALTGAVCVIAGALSIARGPFAVDLAPKRWLLSAGGTGLFLAGAILELPFFLAFLALPALALVQFFTERRPARALAGGGAESGMLEPEPMFFPAVKSNKTFADVVGMDALKARLLEAGKEIIGSQSTQGAQRNGILLFGEPGNGKTFFAEALAGELKLPMITATFGDVSSRWINQTTEQVMDVFRSAHEQAPCVLFLDEIDSLIKDRNLSSGANDETIKTTNSILTELVNARKSRIVVIAATNFLDKLDQAAIREGRFDFKIEVTPPDEPARASIIASALKRFKGIEPTEGAIAQAAKRWEGFSVARIRAVGDEAGRTASKEASPEINYQDLQAALRRVQGRRGAMAPNAPTLDELTLTEPLERQLHGLARRMSRIEEIEARGGKVPSGMLFWGPPGTGKTVTAQALAKSAGWAFLSTSGNALLSNPDKIDEIVREARDIRPCVVFIDEADDALADRQYSRHSASITNRLLTAVDGAGGKVHDIVWVAATNHPEQMDPAALRGGRFTVKVEFALPDAATIAQFLTGWIAQSKAVFCPGLTPALIAQRLEGLSIANVAAVMQQAVDLAVDRWMEDSSDDHCVSLADIEAAAGSV